MRSATSRTESRHGWEENKLSEPCGGNTVYISAKGLETSHLGVRRLVSHCCPRSTRVLLQGQMATIPSQHFPTV